MLVSACDDDKDKIVNFLCKDIGNCVYLYIDIKKYGLGEESPLLVWINDGEIKTVVMKYYDSFQIYSNTTEDDDINEIIELVDKHDVKMISGKKSLLDRIYTNNKINLKYDMKAGVVFEFVSYRKTNSDGIVSLNENEMKAASELMCSDVNFSQNYNVENLAEQMINRLKSCMSRNYGIYKDEKLVGHIATFAEDQGIAVTSGLIVHTEYRNKPYGIMLESYLVNDLLSEGFRVFTFVNEPIRVKFLKALGSVECGEYAKLVRV